MKAVSFSKRILGYESLLLLIFELFDKKKNFFCVIWTKPLSVHAWNRRATFVIKSSVEDKTFVFITCIEFF